jgi:hypothetical protein
MAEKTAAELAAENQDDNDAPQPGEGDEAAEAGDGADDGDAASEGDLDQGDGSEEGESGEDAEEVAAEVEPEPPRRKASDVIRAEKKARKDAEARAARIEAEAAEARREAAEERRRREEAERRATERRQAETEAEEAARVELMSESEKIAHYRQKDRAENDRKYNELRFQQWDSADRSDFRQACRDEPALASVKDKVEAEYQRLVAAGRPVAREVLANQELAKQYRAERLKTGTQSRKRAEAGVRRETTKPPRMASGVPPERRARGGNADPRAARAERLKDVIL